MAAVLFMIYTQAALFILSTQLSYCIDFIDTGSYFQWTCGHMREIKTLRVDLVYPYIAISIVGYVIFCHAAAALIHPPLRLFFFGRLIIAGLAFLSLIIYFCSGYILTILVCSTLHRKLYLESFFYM